TGLVAAVGVFEKTAAEPERRAGSERDARHMRSVLYDVARIRFGVGRVIFPVLEASAQVGVRVVDTGVDDCDGDVARAREAVGVARETARPHRTYATVSRRFVHVQLSGMIFGNDEERLAHHPRKRVD